MHVIGTAGHVDHGKSTLVERLTGIDPDRFEEEKRRGLTIDLGFAWVKLPSGREIGLIDVPGHERFIKNMLAGAGGITVCLFVVAANEGWMPQSAEHLAILDVLGVSSGVVALTKSDTVDAETLEIAEIEVRDHLSASSLAEAPIVACSAATGQGLEDLLRALDEAVAVAPPAPDLERPRLWIDRVFTISGAGTVVTGTLMGGTLEDGDEVQIAPADRRARIRAIQTHRRKTATIGPGNRVALNLVGLGRRAAQRGDAVVRPGAWRSTRSIDARIFVQSPAITGFSHTLHEKGAHLMYVGSAETPVRLKLLAGDHIAPDEEGYAQLYLREALPLRPGDRFVLRDAGRVMTFGGGIVLDPLARPARRGDPRRAALLERLARSDPDEALEALVEAEGTIDAQEAKLRSGATAIPESVVKLGRSLVSRQRREALADETTRALGRHHAARPLQRGMSRESLRAHVKLPPEEFDDLVSALGTIAEEGPMVRLVSHAVTLAPDEARQRERLIGSIEAAGFTPPLRSELAVDSQLLRALTEANELVPIGDFYLTARQAAEARSVVRARIASHGPITVAEIRDLLGTSRKYAVPLCEWFDATGATTRRGDVRLLGPTE